MGKKNRNSIEIDQMNTKKQINQFIKSEKMSN